MIRVIDVTQHYSVRPLPRRVSLEIDHGEMVSILGPNGMGKSTLLGVMAGVIQPQKGWVEIDGLRRYGSADEELAIRKRVYFLPDHPWLPKNRTGREYLFGVGRIYGRDDDRLLDHVERLLRLFELLREGDWPIRSRRRAGPPDCGNARGAGGGVRHGSGLAPAGLVRGSVGRGTRTIAPSADARQCRALFRRDAAMSRPTLIRRLIAWIRVAAPPPWAPLLLLPVLAYEAAYGWIWWRAGSMPELLKPRDGFWMFAALVLGGYRAWAYHPLFHTGYRNWLRLTPWTSRLPLVVGPLQLVPQDLIWLGVGLLAWHDPQISRLNLPLYALAFDGISSPCARQHE